MATSVTTSITVAIVTVPFSSESSSPSRSYPSCSSLRHAVLNRDCRRHPQQQHHGTMMPFSPISYAQKSLRVRHGAVELRNVRHTGCMRRQKRVKQQGLKFQIVLVLKRVERSGELQPNSDKDKSPELPGLGVYHAPTLNPKPP